MSKLFGSNIKIDNITFLTPYHPITESFLKAHSIVSFLTALLSHALTRRLTALLNINLNLLNLFQGRVTTTREFKSA